MKQTEIKDFTTEEIDCTYLEPSLSQREDVILDRFAEDVVYSIENQWTHKDTLKFMSQELVYQIKELYGIK